MALIDTEKFKLSLEAYIQGTGLTGDNAEIVRVAGRYADVFAEIYDERDVVQVVRCKDCAYKNSNDCPLGRSDINGYFHTVNDPDAYCSEAKRI